MDLSIIIVNYKSKDKTFACLDSIRASDLDGINWEAVVVDNHSGDVLASDFQARYPQAKFFQSEYNRGMGGGNNFGAREARGEYLLILNPDTQVKTRAIKLMVNHLKAHPEAGLVGPKLLYPDGSLQNSCLKFPSLLTPIFRRTFLGKLAKKHLDNFVMADFDHETAREVDWVMGSCLLLKKALFDKLSGFDERFFMYFEDIDLCRRVWRTGAKVVYLPQAVVVHNHGRGSATEAWYLAPFTNRLSQIHLASWIKYLVKWKFR